MSIQEKYENWLEHANDEIKEELRGYSEKEIEDSFYKDLTFGTGGLRGVIGVSTITQFSALLIICLLCWFGRLTL